MKLKDQLKKAWRFTLHRRGHHVHSPFVFKFITTYIEERAPYYSFTKLRAQYQNHKKESAWTKRELELIFRMTDRMPIERVCILENQSPITEQYIKQAKGNRPLTISYQNEKVDNHDLILIEKADHNTTQTYVQKIINSQQGNETIMLNLKDEKVKEIWKQIIGNPGITVSIDMVTSGIAFTNKKLHKRHYKAFI